MTAQFKDHEKWMKSAFREAEKAFELVPTDENRKVMELIQKKMSSKSKSKSSPKSTIQ